MTKDEMHEQSRKKTRELTTLIRRSNNLRIIIRHLIAQVRDRVGNNPSGPLVKYLTLKGLMEEASPERRSSLRRALAMHAPSEEGGTKTVQFWSRPGVDAHGEFDVDEFSIVPTQEFARVLVTLTLVQHNRYVSTQRLRAAIGLSRSSWSNIVTSLLPEEAIGDWAGQLAWGGITAPQGDGKVIRKPVTLGPPEKGVSVLEEVFEDHLLSDMIDRAGITKQMDVFDVLEN